MATGSEELYMLNKRDEQESNRLRTQHEFLRILSNGHLLHPMIPLDKVSSVADIATGTATWLIDLKKSLAAVPRTGAAPCYFHGFDISAAQYPADPGDIVLTLHDAREPFPSEFHGRFDVVHVRLLVLAVKETEIKQTLANVVELLNRMAELSSTGPGGYLQWDDYHNDLIGWNAPSTLEETWDIIRDYARSAGLSNQLPIFLGNAATELGLQDVTSVEYSSLSKPELVKMAQQWYLGGLKALLPVALRRSGRTKTEEETLARIQHYERESIEEFKRNVVPDLRYVTVIAKKPAELLS
ncbi:MAG: hypothetical protein M1818_007191 [Claussenomyces sp. TS43310]|nr:MAG: hypothetical protein M1818_007191 [Claussenomyces sp. TS43310]